MMQRTLLCLAAGLALGNASTCLQGKPCQPGWDYCGDPFPDAPVFHLMDQHGCGENDPNGPVFDPVHGVIHHFYQIHLAYGKGHGPDYGHFVSKDFVNWADIRTAIWNGLDTSVTPWKVTPYDNEAIFTGSATVVNGAGPNGSAGVVNIYPGLCNKQDWPACETGTLLAMAIPADYNDVLLTNWTKPSFNPIMENTQRDPSGAWKEPSGEWRLRTYNSHVYGSANDEDFLAGKWYDLGASESFRTCECPSFYPLPASTPGFEEAYESAQKSGALPTHVHKMSMGGKDWWQLGTYNNPAPKVLGNFSATTGWEDLFNPRVIDKASLYASKDNEYPTLSGGSRRINWGWARVPPQSTQTFPREITFNAAARQMQQYPIDELKGLRGTPAYTASGQSVSGSLDFKVEQGVGKQSEVIATFQLPSEAATFGIVVGNVSTPPPSGKSIGTYMVGTDLPGDDMGCTHHPAEFGGHGCQAMCNADPKCKAFTWVIRGSPAGSGDCCLKSGVPCPNPHPADPCTSGAKNATVVPGCGAAPANSGVSCVVDYKPQTNTSAQFNTVSVTCGGTTDTVNLLPDEKTFEIRVFADSTFIEAYFQQGRAAMTVPVAMSNTTGLGLTASTQVQVESVTAYPMKAIWVDANTVRNAPRVYK